MAFKKYILSHLFPGKQKLVPKAQEADAAEQAQPAAAQAAEEFGVKRRGLYNQMLKRERD